MARVRTYKRGKSWQYIFDGAKIDGKRKRYSKGGFRTKAEAEKAGVKAMAEYNQTGVDFTPSEMSYSDFLDYWIKAYGELNLKQVTIENYVKKIRLHIKPYLGMYKLSALSSKSLQDFILKMAQQHYSRNTLSVLKGILSGSLKYAIDQSYLKYNPMYGVKLPSSRNERLRLRKEPNIYIEADWINKIFKRFPEGHPSHIPLTIGYKCGMRLGEVFALTWDCVDFINGKIFVKKQIQWDAESQSWYFSNPKYNSFRAIEIDSGLLELLKKEKDKQERARDFYRELYTYYYEDDCRHITTDTTFTPIELVCARENGTYIQPRTMQHTSAVIHHEMGFKEFTFHSLRHTHTTMLADNGAPPKYVQQRLGHKDIKITLGYYTHLTDITINQGSGVLNAIYNKEESSDDVFVAKNLLPN